MQEMSQRGRITKEDLIDFEKDVMAAWERGEIRAPVHASGGNEEQLIDIFKEVRRGDYVFSGHRNHYHALLHGCDPGQLLDEILGVPGGTCGGNARSMGFIDVAHHFYSSAIVGGCVAMAVGVAWGLRQQVVLDPLVGDEVAAPPRHVWCFVGDGAVDGGHFWEAWQYANGWDLPITFVIEDNDRATCTDKQSRNGPSFMVWRENANKSRVRWYGYKPTYPHVGTGKYVQF